MKFRPKASECELLEYCGLGDVGFPDDLMIRIASDSRPELWNALHRSWIALETGDYINITTPGDYYPINAHIVAAKYEPV